MKTYEVIVPIVGAEVYLVKAETYEEALKLVENGEEKCIDTWWDSDYDSAILEEKKQ